SIYETLVSGVLIGNFCRSAVQVDPEKTLAKFFPPFLNLFLKLTEDGKCYEEDHLDEQLTFILCVLSYLCSTRATFLLPYKENLMKVIDRVILLKDKFAYTYISATFRRILVCSTNAMTVDFKSEANNWGKPSDIEKVKINWSLPGEEDYKFVTEFLDKYLKDQLKYLQRWRRNEIKLKKEERLKSLNLIYACVWGACSSIPPWNSKEVELNERISGIKSDIFIEIGSKDIQFPDGENIREFVAVEMIQILQFILARKESDTEAIKIVIDIYDSLLFSFGGLSDETTWISECIEPLRPFLKNSLVRTRKHIRVLLVQKALKQHETRLQERKRSHFFTELHQQLMFDLITLSFNHYKDVREKASSVLQNMFINWPQCISLAISECLKRLSESGSDDDSQFEGFLDLTCVRKEDETPERLLIFHSDWSTTKRLWLSLFKAKYRDKESIVQKIAQLSASATSEHVDHSLRFMVPEKCRELALKGWSAGVPLDSKQPTDEEMDEADMKSDALLVENVGHYNELVLELVDLIKSHRLHWKYIDIAYSVLTTRIREDTDYPTEAIELFLSNINNDILSIRKQCIDAVGFLLQKQKRRHLKVKINEIDKESMQYKLNVDYLDEKIWESTKFVEKPFWGFYEWPKNDLFVYDVHEKQPKVNRPLKEMTKAERVIYKFFVSKKNIGSLLEFLSLEETKGEDVIDEARVSLFKRLSRNYGISVFKHIKQKILRLVQSDEESEQRCAAEIVTGLVRGSKHWSLQEVKALKEFLSPIIETMLNKLIDETSLDWTIFCGSCFMNRDPRKLSWILDLVLNKAITHKNTFSNSVSLQCLKEIIAQHSWRSVSLRQHLLTVFEPKLTEDYHDLRTKVGMILQSIFEFDNNFFGNTLKDSPSSSDFIDGVIKKLQVYSEDDVNEDDRKKCINLLKTVIYWIVSSFLLNAYPMQPQFYRLFPIYFECLKETKDVELQMEVEQTIQLYSICTTTKQSTAAAIEACETILNSKSWKSRQKLASYLAYQITGNLYQIIAFSEKILQFSKILIEDKNVEVRTAAKLTLKTAIENKVIEVDKQLLQYCKTKCETTLNNSSEHNSMEENRNGLKEKHSGFLALSAIVEAYPFDIPPFIPDILVYLSEHLNEPWLIRKTIKSTFKQFRETHHDNWREHETKFTSVQLLQLEDLLVSPSYYG
ncbi:proteasome activator complex subunit 4B-like isoform X1, partial [Leptotrombidium deliense]